MKTNPSRDQLSKSLDRRVRHLMIRTLERFESAFPDIDKTREGQVFKGDIRTMFNDALRAQRDELNDYEIEYRPLRVTSDNTLAMTPTFLQTVQKVDFGFKPGGDPFVSIYASLDKANVLDALRIEMQHGLLYSQDDIIILTIVGLEECVFSVLPLLDKYRLHPDVRKQYLAWRQDVTKLYRQT